MTGEKDLRKTAKELYSGIYGGSPHLSEYFEFLFEATQTQNVPTQIDCSLPDMPYWAALYSLEEMVEYSGEAAECAKRWPQHLAIGTNGGDETIVIDLADGRIYCLPTLILETQEFKTDSRARDELMQIALDLQAFKMLFDLQAEPWP